MTVSIYHLFKPELQSTVSYKDTVKKKKRHIQSHTNILAKVVWSHASAGVTWTTLGAALFYLSTGTSESMSLSR